MNVTRAAAVLALTALLLAAGCQSGGGGTGGSNLVWKDGGARPSPDRPDPASPPKASTGRVVEIPGDVLAEIMEFVNSERVILADRVEVDASRVPFQVAMVPVIDSDYVEKVDLVAPELRAAGMLLRSRVERPRVASDFPKLRVGDGFDCVATREIQVRTYTRVDERRPAWIRIQGIGNAVYRDATTGMRIERPRITVEAAAVSMGGRLVFRKSVH